MIQVHKGIPYWVEKGERISRQRVLSTVALRVVYGLFAAIGLYAGLQLFKEVQAQLRLKYYTPHIPIYTAHQPPFQPFDPDLPRSTAHQDMRARADPDLCKRWMDVANLIHRRRFASEYGQDWWLYANVFPGPRARRHPDERGQYLDVNAGDYFEGSVTYFFDRCLGWDGLCVEGDPARRDGYLSYRSCKLTQECVVDFAPPPPPPRPADPRKDGHKLKWGPPGIPQKKCTTLDDQINELYHFPHRYIDLMSIGPGGSRDPVRTMRGLLWSRYTIDVIVAPANASVVRFLTKEHDYRLFDQFLQWDVFVRPTRSVPLTRYTVPFARHFSEAEGLRERVRADGLKPSEVQPLPEALPGIHTQPAAAGLPARLVRPQPTKGEDPHVKLDPGMCERWLQPGNLTLRRTFTSRQGADWWVLANLFMGSVVEGGAPKFYLEMYAGNYFQDSVSYALDRCLGWSGLCWEPDTRHHLEGLQQYRTCEVRTSCLPTDEHKVGCETLKEVIDSTSPRVSHIDLLILRNLKGHEGEGYALGSLDWSRVQIDVIVVDPDAFQADSSTAKLLTARGYIRLDQFLAADIYVHDSFPMFVSQNTVPYVDPRIGGEFRPRVLEKGINPGA